ncbi:Fc.00g035120.m01.CDS01 [Cosmosporella sp. VM-42]
MTSTSEKASTFNSENDGKYEPDHGDDESVNCLVEKGQPSNAQNVGHGGPVTSPDGRPPSGGQDSGLLMKGWKRLLSQLDGEKREPPSDAVEGKRRSAAIDRYLDAESQKMKRQLRVMFFGDMGQKDILFKQTRLLEQPLSDAEREEFRTVARQVVLDVVRDCLWTALDRIAERTKGKGKESETEANKALHRLKMDLSPYRDSYDEDAVKVITSMSQNPELQQQLMLHGLSFADIETETLKFTHESFLTCPCRTDHGLVQQLQRVYAADYEPTEHDWFHFDKRRFGDLIREATIHRSQYSMTLFEITRMNSDRRKWIHLFDDVTAMIFVFDLAIYDECLYEDMSTPRFKESLMLFDSICGSRWFYKCPILAILSNVETFRSKLATSPLSKMFPEYNGGDSDAALDYMTRQVREVAGNRTGLHIRLCNVVAREEVIETLRSMEGSILKNAIKQIDHLPPLTQKRRD